MEAILQSRPNRHATLGPQIGFLALDDMNMGSAASDLMYSRTRSKVPSRLPSSTMQRRWGRSCIELRILCRRGTIFSASFSVGITIQVASELFKTLAPIHDPPDYTGFRSTVQSKISRFRTLSMTCKAANPARTGDEATMSRAGSTRASTCAT